jgi:hypothetical protein
MNRGSVNGAPEQLPVGQDAVLLVQEDDRKDFVRQVPQAGLQEAVGLLGASGLSSFRGRPLLIKD